jgi:membrane fusion protein (multidrug efflux system)
MSAIPATRDATETDIPARSAWRLGLSKRSAAALLILCVAVPLSFHYLQHWWQFGRFIETTDDAYIGGEVTAMSTHVAGFVSEILVSDNAHVVAGQLLARIDARDYRAVLDRAQANVAAQTAARESLRAQRLVQQSAIRQTAADLDAKAARAAFTGLDGTRYATLSATNAASVQDAQRAHAQDREARAAQSASQAALAASQLQLSVLDAQIAQAEAAIAQAQADARRAALDVSYTEIRAPIDGYVGNRAARAGEFVAAGGYLLSIIPATGLWVDANFKEDQLAGMQPGQPATLTADVAPGKQFHGRVVSLAPGTGAVFSVIPPENATGNFTKIVQRVPVRISLDSSDARLAQLRPGISVNVSVDTRDAP